MGYRLNSDSTGVTLHRESCTFAGHALEPKWTRFATQDEARASTEWEVRKCEICLPRPAEHRLASGQTVWISRPESDAPRPAVMWLHERYGVVQHPLDMAERLAEAGYVGVCPDLFHRYDGDLDALHRGEARMTIRDDEAVADLDEVIAFLRSESYVQGDRIGIIGVCQTGRQPMLYAARRSDAAAVVALYGGADRADWAPTDAMPVPSSELAANLDCPVLGLFGEADHTISVDAVLALRAAFEKANKSYRIRLYRDAPHGWFNDTMPGRYRPEQTAAAWSEMLAFFEEAFGAGWDRNRVVWDFASDVSVEYDYAKNVRLE